MNNGTKALRTAYEALQHEYTAIENLLKPSASRQLPHPLRDHADKIRNRFGPSMSRAKLLLVKIEAHIAASQLQEGWRDYIELKTEVMPALAGELLAVIGGVYLHEEKLDYMHDAAGASARLSFAGMAEKLVEDLNERSVMGWQSVLIVGEERLTHSEAEIIRLRFPACDLWNLPFTAHEYGYLVANKDNVPRSFRSLRTQVEENVDPANHVVGTLPEHHECYLPEVVELWKTYHHQLRSEDERREFLQQREKQIAALAAQQVAHLCRLFADAFATFFVGPAYLYALLYLRFVPDHTLYQPSEALPPFLLRFVVAFETLKWMNSDPHLTRNIDKPFPFRGVVDEEIAGSLPDSILALWHQILLSVDPAKKPAEVRQEYEDTLKRYACRRNQDSLPEQERWLDRIKETLKEHFFNAVRDTYENWIAAEGLVKGLLSEPVVAEWPQEWTVVNAAWLGRHRNPESAATVEANALRLLGREEELRRLEPQVRPGAAERGRIAVNPDSEDVRAVKLALARNPDLRQLFTEMSREPAGYREEKRILDALAENDEAYDAYVRLYRNSPRAGV